MKFRQSPELRTFEDVILGIGIKDLKCCADVKDEATDVSRARTSEELVSGAGTR